MRLQIDGAQVITSVFLYWPALMRRSVPYKLVDGCGDRACRWVVDGGLGRLVEHRTVGLDSSTMPTIRDLIRAELDRGKSVRDLEIDSGGVVKFQTFQELSNRPPRQFPKSVETIRGMARALRLDETAVVLAYAKGLGIDIRAGSTFALRLPPDVDRMPPQMQNALIAVVRAASEPAASAGRHPMPGTIRDETKRGARRPR